MTLIELLAIHVHIWPECNRAYQDEHGSVFGSENFGTTFHIIDLPEIASDRETAIVTKSKWQNFRSASYQGINKGQESCNVASSVGDR